jgi:hypothetical protein
MLAQQAGVGDAQASARLFNEVQEKICRLQPFDALQNKSIVLIGLVVYFFGDKLTWLGRLPGDIRIERENFSFYFPITSMLLLSVALTLLLRLLQRFL